MTDETKPDECLCVEIVDSETDEVIEKLGPYATQRQAERADDGVSRNLNHDKYFTRLVP